MGAVYGVLKSINREIEILTVASTIPPADIRKASRALQNCYRFYPAGTLHMVVVDPTVGSGRRAMIIDDGRYLFVGPDNGVFTPIIIAEPDCVCHQIANPKYRLAPGLETFHGRDLFAAAAAYLSLGIPLDEFGPGIDDPVLLEGPVPERLGDEIIGQVIDIDAFGNLVSNLPAELVASDSIIMTGGHTIKGLCDCYAAVPEKQPLAYIGSTGLLEIAINKGNAANYFGTLIFDEIKIKISE